MPHSLETTNERLASLENEVKHVSQDVDVIASDVKEIKEQLNKQKGFISGVLFVITPIWIGILALAKDTWDKFVN